MTDSIKTDSKLLDRLKASGQHLTRDQLRKQRVSFIYGSLPQESKITKNQIKTLLDEGDCEAA